MRVLVCPDKFRGTLTARQVADAIARGWRRARPSDELVLEPLADGGEGTLDALVPDADPSIPGFRRIERSVTGPDGGPLDAQAGVRGRTGADRRRTMAERGWHAPSGSGSSTRRERRSGKEEQRC
ncbi:MAG: glycerate kinase [Actinobacteria bacterium]|nr:MAG: glycerate kinase [Actinomycetota bacterium]